MTSISCRGIVTMFLLTDPAHILELIYAVTYFLLYAFIPRLERVLCWISGVTQNLEKAREETSMDAECVQEKLVLLRLKFPSVNHPRPWDFLSVHIGQTSLYTLLNIHCSLYCITTTHAYFVKCHPFKEIYKSETNPFLKKAQFQFATHVYIIPITQFYCLADYVGDPRRPTLWLSNTARCGSTLLGQMFERVPGTLCMSEPGVLTNVSLLIRGEHFPNRGASERTMKSVVRVLCKNDRRYSRVVIKPRYTCLPEVVMMKRLYPEFQHLFLYRNFKNVMMSFYQLLHRDLAVLLMEAAINNWILKRLLTGLNVYLRSMIADVEGKEEFLESMRGMSFMGYATAIVCSNTAVFKSQMEQGQLTMPTLHYDDLMEQPWKVTQKLFQTLDLPSQHVATAMRAMLRDSQLGDVTSNISNSNRRVRSITQKEIDDINKTLRLVGLPDMNSTVTFPHGLRARDSED